MSRNHEVTDPLDLLTFNHCTIARSMPKSTRGQSNGTHRGQSNGPPRGQSNWSNKGRGGGWNKKGISLEKSHCLFCSRSHKTVFCTEYNTALKRKTRIRELSPELCFSCLYVHETPCRTFDTQLICDSNVGRCCGEFKHRRFLCSQLGLQKQ